MKAAVVLGRVSAGSDRITVGAGSAPLTGLMVVFRIGADEDDIDLAMANAVLQEISADASLVVRGTELETRLQRLRG